MLFPKEKTIEDYEKFLMKGVRIDGRRGSLSSDFTG